MSVTGYSFLEKLRLGPKEVHQPLLNQNRKRIALLFSLIAIGSYPQFLKSINVGS